jgi:hypothetical protein
MPTLKFLEGMQTKDNEEALEGSTTSEDDLKADQKGLMSRSTTSSSQPECEPDFNCTPDMEESLTDEEFGYYPDSMARQVTEEMCWNNWADDAHPAWQSDMEYACLSRPLLSQAVPEPYPREPMMHSFAPAVGRTEEVEEECTQSKRKPRSDAHDKAMNGRRRKRESLIDQAARKQKLQQQRAKQQQRRQAGSSAHSNVATQREVSRPQPQQLARFCHKCGGTCQTDYKFCRFCGAHVLFLHA